MRLVVILETPNAYQQSFELVPFYFHYAQWNSNRISYLSKTIEQTAKKKPSTTSQASYPPSGNELGSIIDGMIDPSSFTRSASKFNRPAHLLCLAECWPQSASKLAQYRRLHGRVALR